MVSYYLLERLVWTFLVIVSTYLPTIYAQQPEVTIPQGTLQGVIRTTRSDRDITAFLAIPFAQPPTGHLRFASPVAAGGWNGIRIADADASPCPQILMNLFFGDEDCLYLNVYTPQLPQTTNSSSLPVMVYIHGGAFKLGTKFSTSFGPEYLLDEDVVLVVANYRLGPIGFLSTGDEVAPGNWGLKDQVLALQWVQDNIRHFGGDPDQVTLFGESAGAASTHLLSLSDATVGLFHRYITQSGSALSTWAHHPRDAYSKLAFELGTYVGCSNVTSEGLISCLRTVEASSIVSTESQFKVWHSLPDVIWGPTDEPDVEGAILTDSPSNIFAAGKIRDLPWISGVVQNEGFFLTSGFYQNEGLFQDFLDNIDSLLPLMFSWIYQPDSGAAWVNAVKSYYFNNDLTTDTSILLSSLTLLASDALFLYPAHRALQLHHGQAISPQYFYTFNYRGTFSYSYLYTGTTVDYGVVHGDTLIYHFPTSSVSPDPNLTMSDTDWGMVDTMVQMWTSFAKNGTPTALTQSGGVTWRPYSTEDNYLRIGDGSDPALEAQSSFFEERMQFWRSMELVEGDQDGSDTVTFSPNLILLGLTACAIFTLFE